jgi:hypothetical protein
VFAGGLCYVLAVHASICGCGAWTTKAPGQPRGLRGLLPAAHSAWGVERTNGLLPIVRETTPASLDSWRQAFAI